jgi:hypothetical protein
MLIVDPGSGMLPLALSASVFTTWTLLFDESKTIKLERSGEIAMSPGAPPALIVRALATVSYCPLMMRRPGNAAGLAALCDAKTRVANPLGGPAFFVLLQETRTKLAATSRTDRSATLFKREAPNDMKNGDLSAK